jgi:hypothetical protein
MNKKIIIGLIIFVFLSIIFIFSNNANAQDLKDIPTNIIKTETFLKSFSTNICNNDGKCILTLKPMLNVKINYYKIDENIDVKLKDIDENGNIIFDVENKNEGIVPFKILNKAKDKKKIEELITIDNNLITYTLDENETYNDKYFIFGENSTIITLNVTYNIDDAYVINSDPDTNLGEDVVLSAQLMQCYYNTRAYIYERFNISPLYDLGDINILDANFTIYQELSRPVIDKNLSLYHVYNKTWSENNITWNNQPCGINFNNSEQCNLTKNSYRVLIQDDDYVFKNISITDILKKEYNESSKNINFVMKIDGNCDDYVNSFVNFYSAERTSNLPYITIEFDYIQTYNVTFNVLDNETFEHIKNITISCNNSYSGSGFDSPFNHSFQNGFYNCSFLNTSYYPNSSVFKINDSNLNLTIIMSKIYYNITFNVLNLLSDHLSNITISCNNYYNETEKSSPFTHSFLKGIYSCNFTSDSILNTTIINADSIKNVTVYLQFMNFIFYIRDSFTDNNLQNISLSCLSSSENFSALINSPYTKIFIYLTNYNCNVSKIGYYNFSFSFNTAIHVSALIYMDRIGGLTPSEKSKLDQIYFLQSVEALPEELIIQSQICLDENTLLTSYNPIYCQSPATCQNVTTTCQWGCDQVNMRCRSNPIETGAFFIGFIIYMATIIIIPILILTHHSNKKKRDMIIGFFTFFFMVVIYTITTVFMIPAIAMFFGNDYYFTVILVGITIIIFPLVDLLLIINNIMKNRY